MADSDEEYPGYASMVVAQAKARRDALAPDLRLKLVDITDMLALNPRGYADQTQKLPVGPEVYLYEHPDPPLQVTYQLIEDREPKVIKFVHFAALKMKVKRTLFISYSRKDSVWLRELVKSLKGLETQDIALWDDSQIKASARWRDEIDKALADARAALLLISQDFLNSEFISQKELPALLNKARDEGLKIFWVPVSRSEVEQTPIIEYEAAVDDTNVFIADFKEKKAERKRLYLRIYKRISEALAS